MSDRQTAGAQPTITAVDLFCGAGGFSEGLSQAADELGFELREAAVNHWDQAVETHEANHPDATSTSRRSSNSTRRRSSAASTTATRRCRTSTCSSAGRPARTSRVLAAENPSTNRSG